MTEILGRKLTLRRARINRGPKLVLFICKGREKK